VAGPTNTERIQELNDRLISFVATTTTELNHLVLSMQKIESQVQTLTQTTNSLQTGLAVVEQRCSQLDKAVEKIETRRWQLWLAIISGFVALGVALLKR
jgi:hypothetical protein